MTTKILITGGTGFLGSALSRHFMEKNFEIAILTRNLSSALHLANLKNEMEIGQYLTEDDIENFVRRVRPDIVIHTACAYGRNGESVSQVYNANVMFGLKLIDSLSKVEKSFTFLNVGTGLNQDLSSYAISKRHFSELGKFWSSQSNGKFRFLNLLLQHMYGPSDDPNKFTSMVIRACGRNLHSLKLTKGKQRRDFIFVEDVVAAIETLVMRNLEIPIMNDIEIGTGFAPTVKEFVETVHRLTNSTTKLVFGAVPYRKNEEMLLRADISFLKSLGWAPKYNIESGLEKTVQEEFPGGV